MSEEFGTDIEGTERMVREWQENAAEKAEKFGRMQTEIEAISVTESSGDGAVRVTVGSNGILQNLELADHAARRPMAKLATEIMRVVQCARSRIPELMRQAAADTVGTEDPAVQHVLSRAHENFPEPADGDESAEQQSPRSGARGMSPGPEDAHGGATAPERSARSRQQADEPDDDDDFEGRSFLR